MIKKKQSCVFSLFFQFAFRRFRLETQLFFLRLGLPSTLARPQTQIQNDRRLLGFKIPPAQCGPAIRYKDAMLTLCCIKYSCD